MALEYKISTEAIAHDLSSVRIERPLVQNITNIVAANLSANALLAIGASPVMTMGMHDSLDMLRNVSALVLNIGTMKSSLVKVMGKAGEAAFSAHIPLIFDPVGVSATFSRMTVALSIVEKCHPAVIRGNASEIMALSSAVRHHSADRSKNECQYSTGIDSVSLSSEAVDCAVELASATNSTVCVSGETDYVTDGKRLAKIQNGASIMRYVTGLGCTATSLIGAFASVNHDYFSATISAMAVMAVAGELAASESKGPASFQTSFIDCLYLLSGEEIRDKLIL